jgi:hypothetical protein
MAFAATLVVALAWAARLRTAVPRAFDSIRDVVRDKEPWPPGSTALVGATTAAAILLVIALDASVLRVFVAYGRIVRQIVPFLCIATAFVVIWWLREPITRRGLAIAATVVLVLNTAFGFAGPFKLEYPRDLEARLFEFSPLSHALSVDGPPLTGPQRPGDFVLVNAQYLYPPRGSRSLPAGSTVFAVPHPLTFRPYQYEGFRRYERYILRQSDISMRLIRTSVPQP